MMNGESKRKIDGLRDLLVGKLPVPTDQVKQITLGLIYKFMGDMDEQNRELGGGSFFSGEYAQYAWKHLLEPSLSAYERTAFYAEGLEKMSLNPGIPQLFRDIFKGAFLPFRDPAIVDRFLKGLNEFTYTHSEDLGDAYEYLLSIMGAQGDAGQFRTPRHIIDFIVACVQPQKDDRILDPACGTAGFLVSAYKYILRENTLPDSGHAGSALTSAERKRLTGNFTGYDISQDMTRISLVNLYLHQFSDPRIFEYDSLTSLDRWTEVFDCILTNPPFMSPKGGIQPHNRFGVKSSRSEVLFVDYILEHLSPGGRAGVIVPEGIIFQSGNAYKQLRRKLVEEGYLYAVVSLPAGVFQPYSGVKTSILLIDRRLAQKAKDILFLKVEADGFDLGATKKPIEKNDLPACIEQIKMFRKSVDYGEKHKKFDQDKKFVIEKDKIINSQDLSLNSDRFISIEINKNNKWPLVSISDVCEILDKFRKPVEKSVRKKGPYPYYGATGIVDFIDQYIFDEKLVLIGEDGAKWGKGDKTAFIVEGKCWVNNHAHVLRPDRSKVLDELLVHMLNEMDFTPFITGITVPKLNQEKLGIIKIPLPPLELQRQLVAEIEGWQKVIDGARQVVANWKPEIKVEQGWKKVKVGDVCEILDKFRKPVEKSLRKKGSYPYYGATGIVDYVDEYIFDEKLVLIGEDGAKWGKGESTAFIIEGKSWVNNHAHVLKPNRSAILDEWIVYIINEMDLTPYITGVTVPKLNQEKLREILVPLTALEDQTKIVHEILEQQKGVDACKQLIAVHEAKIRARIREVWGE